MLSPLIVGCRPRSHTGLKLNGADIMMKIIKFKKTHKKKPTKTNRSRAWSSCFQRSRPPLNTGTLRITIAFTFCGTSTSFHLPSASCTSSRTYTTIK